MPHSSPISWITLFYMIVMVMMLLTMKFLTATEFCCKNKHVNKNPQIFIQW